MDLGIETLDLGIEKFENLRIEEKLDPETDKTVDLEIREKEACAEASDPRSKGVHEPRIKCAGPEINSYQDPEIAGASEPEIVVQELALEEAEVVEVDPEIEELTKPRIDEDVGAAAAGQEEPGRACAAQPVSASSAGERVSGGTRVSLGVEGRSGSGSGNNEKDAVGKRG